MQAAFYVGIAVSAVTGCMVIAFFLRFLRTHTLRAFITYRIAFGVLVLGLAFSFARKRADIMVKLWLLLSADAA